MSQHEIDALRDRLKSFGERLDNKTAEYERDGRFQDVHRTHLQRLRDMYGNLSTRFSAGPASGPNWAQARDEAHSELEVLVRDLDRLIEQLDAEGARRSS